MMSENVADIPLVAQDIVIDTVTSSVDYLTITVSNSDKSVLLMQEAQRLKVDLEECGWKVRKWGMQGYGGYSIAGLRWGMRTDGCIMMLSGQDAAINWVPALALAQNVTRLDLAVTVALAGPITDVAKRAYALMLTDPHGCPSKKRKDSYVENSAGGQTVYIGSRASDQFGRLYDKGCESAKDACAPPGLLWRYEVEFKAYRAKKLAYQMGITARQALPSVSEEIAKLVHTWFLARGIRPLYTTQDHLGEWVLGMEARVTDDDCSLNWLTLQVRPTVDRLQARGRSEGGFKALGITSVPRKADVVDTM